jgi:hypothetical protein
MVAAHWAGFLMARRRSLVDLMALRIAFERSGRVLPIAAQASPHPPPDPPADEALEFPTEELAAPNRGKLEWVTRAPAATTGRFDWDYDPWRRGLK